MLKKQPADDLFEKSSMSFGEHLEELRKALVKAFIWVGLGTCVGLYFAEDIVKYIQSPLELAITDFYVSQAKAEFREANGQEPSDALAKWIYFNKIMPERVFIDPHSLQEVPSQAALTPKSVAAEVSATKVLASDSATDAEAVGGESAQLSDAADSTELDRPNPWQGIDLAKLQRLQPFLLFRPIPSKLVALTITEGFMVWLKAGLVAGVVIASPGVFWHIWQFLAAGLYPHERRYVFWYLPLSLLLFLAGVALAFFAIFRLVLGFLMTYTAGLNVEFTPRLNEFMSFALMLPLGFGVAFQLPILMLGLHRFGIVSVDSFTAQWRIAVLVIAFLSMLLTPADIYSMLGLFIPLVGLYFLGILLCKYMPQGAGVGAPAHDPKG
ncbi:MAG: twin-arginine translocase subunit TatC [Planctomycetales bacterium]|nr:twin-arginine translocase subunit TatC [Planctomycetales bacterium]